MSTSFILYSQPGCMPCKGVKRELDRYAPDNHVVQDVTQSPAAVDYIKSLGYQGTPVVVASNGEHWHGHRPGRIKEMMA